MGEILVLFHESQEDRWYVHAGAQSNSWPLTQLHQSQAASSP